ncbi:MAG: hypothetical protein KF687_00170 [Cyclobacteriaceae bacterium]|nr:hypothetical protein [Cyclobacteriaceae bacterium]
MNRSVRKLCVFLSLGLIGLILLTELTGCSDDEPAPVVIPELTTTAVTGITSTGASSGGAITSDGGATITVAGVCWGTSPAPTTAGSKTTDAIISGSFTSTIAGLSPGVTYFVRAYATNSAGTAYGNELSFTIAPVVPQITTSPVTELTISSAKTGGTIISNGGALITESGIVWGTVSSPTVADTKISSGASTGSFVSQLTGLTQGATYFVRAFATNSVGTAYGNEISFTTLEPVTDFDGNVYEVVRIGSQTWMAENLLSIHYADGTAIDGVFAYNDDPATVDPYGRLYTWPAARRGSTSSNTDPSGIQGACPNGYHLPSRAEWEKLLTELGGESVAGGKLKATGTLQAGTGKWDEPNTGATNSSGFTGLPAGIRYPDNDYQVRDRTGFWWSTTLQSGFITQLGLGHAIASANLLGSGIGNAEAVSVRCVKN